MTAAVLDQLVVEAARGGDSAASLTQLVVEAARTLDPSARLTQLVVETARDALCQACVAQIVVEVLRVNGDVTSITRKVPVDTYPSFPQLVSSTPTLADDLKFDRAVSGLGRARAFYPDSKREFNVVHVLTSEDKDTLLDFYASHRTDPFWFDWDEKPTTSPPRRYGVLFNGPLSYRPADDPDLWRFDVKLAEY